MQSVFDDTSHPVGSRRKLFVLFLLGNTNEIWRIFSSLVNPNLIVIRDYHIDDLSMHHFELCLRGSFILQRKPTAFWCQCYSLWL
jgi:hypothetical protein